MPHQAAHLAPQMTDFSLALARPRTTCQLTSKREKSYEVETG
jgi:hypothetical protein